MTIIYAIIIFCLLIFVHELGHFIVAKACGVKVNEFAIGMGPAIFKKQKGETLYAVRLFPIGGFCAMEGEDEDSEDDRAFNNKPAWQRALVLTAGSFMNLLTAVVLMIVIAFVVGQATTTVNEVLDDSPAYRAGMVVERDGAQQTLTAALEYDKESGRNKIGITPEMKHSVAGSVGSGMKNTWNMTVMMYKVIKQLFTGDVSVSELSGPVGIVYAVNQSAKAGVIYVVYLASLLSLNLAIMNMLPFPALDGGRLLFLLIRKITGKRITDAIEGKIHFIGIILLMVLMVYVTWNDIVKFIAPIFS